MTVPDLLRNPRILLCLVALGVLWPATRTAAQEPTPATTAPAAEAEAATACAFTKPEAVEANGGPLGSAIWGRLCQVKDGKAAYPEGVTVTVLQDGAPIGETTTDEGGVFVVEIPGNGTYDVTLDTETLPDGFSLTDDDLATLAGLRVNLGDQQAIFRMGEDTRGQRTLSDYLTTAGKGLRFGLILAVAAVGLSLVYGVTGLVNFAHAELVTVGAIVTYAISAAGIPFWLAVVPGILIGGLVGWTNDRALWQPLRNRRMALLSMMVVSIGLSTMVRNILQIAFKPNSRRYTASSGQLENDYGPFSFTGNDLIIMGLCVLILLAMTVLLRKTRLGTAIRAVSDNPDLAASSGIAVNRIVGVVWALCGALAAAGGIFYGLTVSIRYDMGFVLLLSMFAAVVLGGLGNAYGAVLGAIVIGVVQETSGLFVDTAYKFVVALAVLILVLLIRPQGILGQPERFG